MTKGNRGMIWVHLMITLLLAAGTLGAAGGVLADDHGDDGIDAEDGERRDRDDHDEEDDDERGDDDDEREARDHDREDDDDRAKHEVSIDVSRDEARIELKGENDRSERKVEFGLETGDETEFELEFETENETGEVEEKLEAELHRLVEYVDGNGNGRYDDGEEIASSWALSREARDHDDDERDDDDDDRSDADNGTVEWQALVATDVTADDGTPGKHIEARASFGPDGNATFGLDLFVFGDFAEVQNSTLEPTEVKIDFLIDDYPYVRNDTALALILSTKTEQEIEGHGDDDEEGVAAAGTVDGTDFRLEFTWKDTATVDGSEEPVHTTLLRSKTKSEFDGDGSEAEAERTFALSYARGDHIVHDPKAGVHYATASDGTAATPGVGALMVVVAIGGVAVACSMGRPRRD